MNLEKIFDTYELETKKLIELGFKKIKDSYQKTYSLSKGNFEVTFMITKKSIKIKVVDTETKEDYLPFYVEDNNQEFVNKIKNEVAIKWQEILTHAFRKTDTKSKVITYMKEKYHLSPNYSWKDDNTTCTFKTQICNKWFAIIMEIPYKKLGIEKNGKIFIINLKNKEEKVKDIIDNKNIFKAYHMNKKYWYTVTLTKNINLKKLYLLIDESYNLVENKKKS